MSIFDKARTGTLVGETLDVIYKNNPNLLEQQEPDTGYTPLAIAVVEGFPDEVLQLLSKGVEANGPSANGETPLLLAVWKTTRERPLIVQRLLRSQREPRVAVEQTCAAAEYKTPLIFAVEKKDLDCIRMLRDAGASATRTDGNGLNAKEVAENLGDTAVIQALSPRERSMLARLATTALSFLLYIISSVNKFFNGAVQRATGGFNPVLDQPYRYQAVNLTDITTEPEFVDHVSLFVEENPVLARFFKGKPDFVKELAKKATELQQDSSSVLGSKDVLPKTIKVSMYQQVIYCDDSGSMNSEDRWNDQKRLAHRIANITTRILPEGEGVALRFINQDVDNSWNLNLDRISEILEPLSPRGGTPIGTTLRTRIFEPLVYNKIQAKTFERPLLVSIITDGVPTGEDPDEIVNAIVQCGGRLESAGYPRESVKFVIGQIGTDVQATAFIESLGKNPDIAPVAFIMTDKLDEKLAVYRANERELDLWLIETLFAPIKDA